LEYAGHSFWLHELTKSAITKATKSTTADLFIKNSILIIHKNKLFILNTIFVPKIKYQKGLDIYFSPAYLEQRNALNSSGEPTF
jgi:hypothetical protein